MVCRRDDDDDDDCGAGGSSVKEKIKEKISHLNPRKDKEDDIPLANIDLKKEKKDKPEIKVDFISDSHKVRPRGFVDFDKVKDGWPAIVEKMLEENYTLSALLKISQPLKCRDNVLEIGVRSRFYKDRLEDMRNRQILEKVISEVAKAAVSICGVIKDDLEPIEFEEKEAVPAAAVVPPSVSRSTVVIGPSSAPVKKNDSPIAIERPKDAAQEVASMF